jgi:hypothetical protein
LINIYHKEYRCDILLFEGSIKAIYHDLEALEGEVTLAALVVGLEGLF